VVVLSSSIVSSRSLVSLHPVYAEDVIFVVPGSSDPSVMPSFDPPLQMIQKGQSITFVNTDGLDHHLIVKDAKDQQIFDTGSLKQNQFISHTFPENGEYTIQDSTYLHMKATIVVTDDLLTLTKTIESQKLDVQLTRSPANPGVNEEIFYKITFINKEYGKNHPHIDFTLTFNDTAGNQVDAVGAHTVDGQEFAKFKFDKKDAFIPIVKVYGVSFIPIDPEIVQFDTVVTPEFPAGLSALMALAFGTIALYMRKDVGRIYKRK